MDSLHPRTSRKAFGSIFTSILLGLALWLVSCNQTQPTPSNTNSSRFYERIEVWDFREDDTVRFTILDTYPEAETKRQTWFSAPLVWNDADIAQATPIRGTQLEHRMTDSTYGSQTYRAHSYLIASDQREFGYSVTFTILPHLHVTSTLSRLISIGVYPARDAAVQTRSVIVVILPDDVRDIAITDMEPYKTLTQNARILYYYDAQVTAHESIHIAYTLTGAPTTDMDVDMVIKNSKP